MWPIKKKVVKKKCSEPKKIHKRYYGNRSGYRQYFRDACFIYYAAGYTGQPKKARQEYLEILFGYSHPHLLGSSAGHNIGRIKRAMDAIEHKAMMEAGQ